MKIFIGTSLLLVAVLGVNADINVTHVPTLGGRIVGGVAVDITNFPHQLSLRYYSSHVCGASIIAPNWALTAAHCLVGYETYPMTLSAGSSLKDPGGTIYTVFQRIVYPGYNRATHEYDAALLKVSTPFIYGINVRNIPLQNCCVYITPGVILIATGWGKLMDASIRKDEVEFQNLEVIDAGSFLDFSAMHINLPNVSVRRQELQLLLQANQVEAKRTQ